MNQFQMKWKELAAKKQLTSSDMAVLCISKAVHEEQRAAKDQRWAPVDALAQAKYYLQKSFKPITKPSKLNGGAYPYGALYNALYIKGSGAYTAFNDLWGEEMRNRIEALAKEIRGDRYGQVKL